MREKVSPTTAFEIQSYAERVRSILSARERRVTDDPALTCAAVLIPLVFKVGEWHVVVTQRTQKVDVHRGQISFPGGVCDAGDYGLLATALRETYEEIGVPPQDVTVLGMIDDFPTITGFNVTPIVGIIPHPFAYRPNPGEVEAVLEVPLSFFRDAANLRVEPREHRGKVYEVLSWDYGRHRIWGATARMLHEFLELVAV